MRKVFKRSRWHYFKWYLFAFALLALGTWLMDVGVAPYAYLCYGGFVILVVNFEIAVYNHRLVLEDESLTMIMGVMRLQKKIVGYNEILDLGVHQSFIERILGYGHLEVDTGGTADIEISMPAIKNPAKVQEIIQQQIRELRSRYVTKNVPRPMGRVGQAQQRQTK